VWAAIDPDTNEMSVLGYRVGGNHVPLIAIDPASAENNAVMARMMHAERMDSPDLYHFHFTNCEELEIVQ